MDVEYEPMSAIGHFGVRVKDLVIGCVLAICGNLLISVSLNLQKYTHMKNEAREVAIHYTKDPMWWLGVSLMVIGEVGNFSAYGYAPASLVAPLGTTTVIANMFLAALFLKEKIGPENLFGSALAVLGAVLVVGFAPKKEKILDGIMLMSLLKNMGFIVYTCIELAILAVLLLLLHVKKMTRVVIYLLIVAIIASFSVISAKAVSSMVQLTFAGDSQLKYISLYVMLIIMVSTAILQVKYLNMAMKKFESTIVVPTNFVFFTLSAIIAGIVFYQEFMGMTALEIFMFLFGCSMSFLGVYFIVVGRKIPAAVIQATQPAPDQPPQSIASRIFPCKACFIFPAWLCATVNVGKVQPSGYTSHLNTDEEMRRPFVGSDAEDSDSSQETLYTTTKETNGSVLYTRNYGADN
ncbi:NIPA-like protein 2 isoform X2 [Dreissena polymorpha]|uniref:NIPA-like protein 2 isoform X2 n=1 Tax=Dreissena polymorpha TaxID=45954 RepID=UPI002263F403|nr:NIPA-like protein 2 isoform X2 [Dreissena polymorpha]